MSALSGPALDAAPERPAPDVLRREQRRKAVRTAWLLAAVALGFFAAVMVKQFLLHH